MGNKRRRSGHRNSLYEESSRWGIVVGLIAAVVVITFVIGMIMLWSDPP